MESMYLESSVISYIVSEPSKDIIILSHQLLSRDWWKNAEKEYNLYISQPVISEISKGNKELAEKRINLIKDFPVLDFNEAIDDLILNYMNYFKLPVKMELDVTHIAYAVYYELDYLVTWNCRHIANAHFRHQITKYNILNNLFLPELCTPEELLEKWR